MQTTNYGKVKIHQAALAKKSSFSAALCHERTGSLSKEAAEEEGLSKGEQSGVFCSAASVAFGQDAYLPSNHEG